MLRSLLLIIQGPYPYWLIQFDKIYFKIILMPQSEASHAHVCSLYFIPSRGSATAECHRFIKLSFLLVARRRVQRGDYGPASLDQGLRGSVSSEAGQEPRSPWGPGVSADRQASLHKHVHTAPFSWGSRLLPALVLPPAFLWQRGRVLFSIRRRTGHLRSSPPSLQRTKKNKPRVGHGPWKAVLII